MSYSIIELYEDQLNHRNYVYDGEVFKEYCELYRFLNNVRMSDTEIIKTVSEHSMELSASEELNAHEIATKLKSMISDAYHNISKYVAYEDEIIYVLMIGDSSIDGHGGTIDGKPYVFIDILAIAGGIEFYDLGIFLMHESVHALHYIKSPQMSFKSYRGIEDMYFKRLASEGIATYISGKIRNSHLGEEFWLGYFDKNQTSDWITYCTRSIGTVSAELRNSIESDALDVDLYYKLFSIYDPNETYKSRLAYYYGYEICLIASQAMSIETLLSLGEDKWSKMIKSYFELN